MSQMGQLRLLPQRNTGDRFASMRRHYTMVTCGWAVKANETIAAEQPVSTVRRLFIGARRQTAEKIKTITALYSDHRR
jgi:hypothetical protein